MSIQYEIVLPWLRKNTHGIARCGCGDEGVVHAPDPRGWPDRWATEHLARVHGLRETYSGPLSDGTAVVRGIERRMLTADERSRYSMLVAGCAPVPPTDREDLRLPSLWIGGVVVPLLCVAAMLASGDPGGEGGLWARLTLVASVPVWVLWVVLERRSTRRRAAMEAVERVEEFLTAIGYASRSRRPGGDGGVSGSSGLRRQRQHEWYGDHRSLDWQDRERAEIRGVDADTYVSNMLEHDKD